MSPAIRMSAAIASESPAPTATPLIPATTGLSVSNRSASRNRPTQPFSSSTCCCVREPGVDRLAVATAQVEPGAERVAVAGEGHDPDVVVGLGVADRPHDAPAQRRGERVLPFGPIEPQDPDVLDGLDGELRHAPKAATEVPTVAGEIEARWTATPTIVIAPATFFEIPGG